MFFDMESDPLARTAPDDTTLELRGQCPRDIVDVLDAVSMARRITRTELVNQILGQWTQKTVNEATLVHRVLRGNPKVSDGSPVDVA